MREQTFQKYCNKVRQLEKRVKTLEQETSILDKIRAEIFRKMINRPWRNFEDIDPYIEVLQIIEKYRTGQEAGKNEK